MKLHTGENVIDGIPVVVTRRRARHIRIWIKVDGTVAMTIPHWGATLAQGAAFLASKWEWACEARKCVLSRPVPAVRAISASEAAQLQSLLAELHALWADRLGEPATTWKTRRMKTRWGVCNYVRRRITYSLMLAGMPRELVEYVVVHELTHLKAHGHGPRFQAFMDARLPGWRTLRKRLNHRES
ncbi:MAG: M48 family metallopeptidase [Kiritimatiellae bacterium]|nr:M48 family metallopeptidase [Kiritimatiellia bacterium]